MLSWPLLQGDSGKHHQEVLVSCASWMLCDQLSAAAAPCLHGRSWFPLQFYCHCVLCLSDFFFTFPCPSKVLHTDLGIKEAPTLLFLEIWGGPQVPWSDTLKTP